MFISINDFNSVKEEFIYALNHIKEVNNKDGARNTINKLVYTSQQAIEATLDALPSGKSNFARKINGDLFERYIRLLISKVGVIVKEGSISVPVIVNNEKLFDMLYQHDLILEKDGKVKAIGSVKTSSKDRNDVQRKSKENNYGLNTTFLTGHLKVIQLNSTRWMECILRYVSECVDRFPVKRKY